MNNEQMVSENQREWLKTMADAIQHADGKPMPVDPIVANLLRALLAQPQGGLVALPAHQNTDLRSPVHGYAKGWNACLDEIAKLGPLYTHADAGEVEQGYHHTVVEGLVNRNNELREEHDDLRAERDEWKQRCQYNADTAHDVANERDTLRAQLAALVRDCMSSDFNEHWDSFKNAEKSLSARAEPSAPVIRIEDVTFISDRNP